MKLPKKPVATYGKKTVPTSLDWGPGIKRDKLAYINDEEAALLQAKRHLKEARSYKGVRSFADDSASSKGVSRGGQGAVGSGSTKTANGSVSNKSSGSRGSGVGTGGGGEKGPNRGIGGGGSGGTNVGGQRASSNTSPKSPMSGQGSSYKSPEAAKAGNTKAINKSFMDTTRSANQSRMAQQSLKSFGPRVGADKTAGTISPSKIAAQNTLDRIAAGSSVAGNAPTKFQDRVLGDPTRKTVSQQEVKMQQEPSFGPNRGLGAAPARPSDYSKSSMFEGANSPFADDGVAQYNRETFNQPNAANAAKQYGQYRSPPSPTTGAYRQAMGQYAAGQDPTGIPMPNGRAYAVSQQPNPTPMSEAQRLAAQYGQYRSPPSVAASAQVATPPSKTRQDRVITIDGVSYNVSPEQIGQLSPSDQAAVNAQLAANQVPTYTPINTQVPQYGFTNPYANGLAYNQPPQATRGLSAASLAGQPEAVGQVVGSPSVQPANAMQDETSRIVSEAVTDADTYSPNYSPGVAKLVEPVQKYFADKLGTRVAPSQQDSWMGRLDQGMRNTFGDPSPNSEYARVMAMQGQRGSDTPGYTAKPPEPAPTPAPVAAAPPPPALAPLPPYVNYQNLPGSYYGGVSPSPLVSQYLDNGYASGGSVAPRGNGDRIDAAIRLARLFA